jgi:ACS family sodium-dependent inorganic phosphate cotransporter
MSGIPVGTLFGLIVTGWIVSEFDWPAAFYTFGIAGLFWAFAWFALIHDDPAKHPGISQAELDLIGDTAGREKEKKSFPWRVFLRLPAFWALLTNHFCSNVVLYIALAWLPSYFRDAQGLSISGAGLYSAAPWLSMFLMANVGGWLADKMISSGVSTTKVRKIMQTTGLIGAAIFMFLLRDVESANVAVLLLCAVLGFGSFTISGFGTNHLDIAPQHAGFLVGITNTFGTIPGIVGVALTGWLVETTGSYDSVFLMVACVNVVGAVVWLLFSSGERLVE